MQLDPTDPPDIVFFDGVIYRRMGGSRKYYLSQSTTNAGRRGAKGLHVAIWEAFSGQTVPPGHEVNHRNGDTFDFSFENLESLPKAVHRALPKRYDAAHLAHLARIRPSASAWHKSETGRAWHRANTAPHLEKARTVLAAKRAAAKTPPT
jgi:HNH endonuclease